MLGWVIPSLLIQVVSGLPLFALGVILMRWEWCSKRTYVGLLDGVIQRSFGMILGFVVLRRQALSAGYMLLP